MKIIINIFKLIVIFILLSIPIFLHNTKYNIKDVKSTSYSVNISPCGNIHFNKIPKTCITLDSNWNDMLYALNLEKNIIASGYSKNIYNGFYHQLNIDSKLNKEKFIFLGENNICFDKELLYHLNANVHHIDPMRLVRIKGWNDNDIKEISKNVGPFFANRFSRDAKYVDNDYKFYSIQELLSKMGRVYKKSNKTNEINAFINKFVESIKSKLPPIDKRPTVALIYYGKKGITPYGINNGFGQKQYVDLGVIDIFKKYNIKTYGENASSNARFDIEGLLKLNPDIIILPFGIYSIENKTHGTAIAYKELMDLRDDPIGKRLNAVKNNKIYLGGTPLQGPIFYIFQLEMAAKQIYPEIFGKYHENNIYIKKDQLFSRKDLEKILKEN